MSYDSIKFAFFGSSEFSVYVLEELKIHGLLPTLIITTPDKPKGRKLILTPNEVKVWAQNNNVEVIDPKSLKNNPDLILNLKSRILDLFLVASYGKIIPKDVFHIPERKTLNIHPSLLPKYRGASPIQSQILNDDGEVGVSLMIIDEEMDHGPILAQKKIELEKWPIGRIELEKILAIEGARIFSHYYKEWLGGAIDGVPQKEEDATFCTKIEKDNGKLDIDLENLEKDAYQNLLKIKAYEGWPGTYFFYKDKRIIIKSAEIIDNKLKLNRVIPEGKKEMSFEDFLRGIR